LRAEKQQGPGPDGLCVRKNDRDLVPMVFGCGRMAGTWSRWFLREEEWQGRGPGDFFAWKNDRDVVPGFFLYGRIMVLCSSSI
jgi:hypothetical protein